MKVEGQNIILIGFMGCGKSTLGKKLAKQLNYEFVDMDNEIEKLQNKIVSEIFEQEGEAFFRLKEHELLKSYLGSNNKLISTGGGAPCFHDNMKVINELGVSVYIKLSPNALLSRLKGERSNRPLVNSLSEEELFDFIDQRLKEREVDYNKASIIHDPFKETTADLLKQL